VYARCGSRATCWRRALSAAGSVARGTEGGGGAMLVPDTATSGAVPSFK
jgi:hypothetical protein